MVYVFLADGFEDIEAIGTVDILRRCGYQVQTLSVTGKRIVTSAHGVIVKADSMFRRNHLKDCEAMIFPGGLEGAKIMAKHTLLRQAIQTQYNCGVLIAAICAAPMVLYSSHVLKGKHFTMYPGLQEGMEDVFYHGDYFVVEHENIITALGPGATMTFAMTIARRLSRNPRQVDEIERGMFLSGFDPSMNTVLTI